MKKSEGLPLRLVNLSASPNLVRWFKSPKVDLEDFMTRHQLDGIEWLVYNDSKPPAHRGVRGWHLRYWPYWLDLWHGNWEGLKNNGIDEATCHKLYGGTDRNALISWYREEHRRAEAFGATYMVLHCAHVDFEEVFHRQYRYSDEAVVEATIELVNQAFDPKGRAMLLFENLWWPGLRFDCRSLVDRLLTGIHYERKGLVLDLAHLALNSGDVYKPQDLLRGVEAVLETLGPWKNAIQVVHCSDFLAGDRFSRLKDRSSPGASEDLIQATDPLEARFSKVLNQIQQMDNHRPIQESILAPLLERVKPAYFVHEILPVDFNELEAWLRFSVMNLGILEPSDEGV